MRMSSFISLFTTPEMPNRTVVGQNISNPRYELLKAVGYGALAVITGIAMEAIECSSAIVAYRSFIPSFWAIHIITGLTVIGVFLGLIGSLVDGLFNDLSSTVVAIYFFAAITLAPEVVAAFLEALLEFLIYSISMGIYAPHCLLGAIIFFICYERINEHLGIWQNS